ncbi:MAG: S8 family serine peptidase, partial [Blastocatellia bacterium]|nr:S8 family serine peptidase [Blastocatellia bacterium]
MRKAFSRRVVFVLASVFIAVVFYFSFGEKPNSAQAVRTVEPKAKFEQFSRPDIITGDIRDRSKEIVRVQFHSIADRENVTKYGRIVQDFGSSVVLAKSKNADMSRSGLDVHIVETTINLPGKKFEPIETAPEETIRPGAESAPSAGYYIVQLGGTATDEWLESLRDAGVEVLQYVPHQAFFVYGEGDAIAKIAGHSRVRWVGGYSAGHKLSPEVGDFARSADGGTTVFDVAVFNRADLKAVGRLIGGRVIAESKLPNNFFNVVRVQLPASELEKVAAIDGVFRIDPYVRPSIEDERAAQIISGNFSSTTVLNAPGYNPLAQFGVDGTGVTVMVSDDGISIPGNGGFYVTSTNTVDGPLRGTTAGASGGHGHINASIIAGNTPFGILDPTGYNYGLGIAPKSNIVNIPFLKSGNTTTDAQAVDDALNTLGPNGARATISNNSWGAGTNGNSYDALAAQYDGLVRDGSLAPTIDPFSIIFSAGNSGPGALSLTRPKVSKNTIAVANSENIRPEFTGTGADNLDDLRTSSSRGPAADGRIKPDITAPGTVITGSRAGTCGSVTSCFDANHAYSSGTSHAAPQVAGAAALFTQYWRNSHAGASPKPSLIKAAIINTAQEMNGLTTNLATIPNGNEGWGRLNMKFMMNTGVPTQYFNEEHHFTDSGTFVGMIGEVADASKPTRVTLVWTDPPGIGNPALVNNLDLMVNIGGNIYRGNSFAGGVSVTGGTPDVVNNVENVFLPAGIPAGTVFVVSISAVALNGDGILGNADATDQHFSLVAHNFQPLVAPPDAPFDFDGDDKTDISIFRSSAQQWWIERSSNGQSLVANFGANSEPGTPVPADYTGDGKTDIAVRRNSDGVWLVLRSEDFSYFTFPFGVSLDVPAAGDFDDDGKADPTVFRGGEWYIQRSTGGTSVISFGQAGDKPIVGDFDGDGTSDIGIFRPSNGQWWLRRSTAGVIVYQFGSSTDKLVPGDYTGDRKTDVAFWRPSTGEWYVLRSEDGSYYSVPFGATGDLPVPGDYDGDGKSDTAVFRPTSGTWFVDRSTAGIQIK